MLHLIRLLFGGIQITFLIKGAFGGCALILKCFKIENSSIEQGPEAFELLLERATFTITRFIEVFQGMSLSLNID